MRTTLNIDPDLLAEAQRLSGARTKTRAVELGLQALVARESARRLAKLAGQYPEIEEAPRRRTELGLG